MQLNILSPTQCECTLTEFKKLVEFDIKEINCDSFKFSQTDHRLDNFIQTN